MSFGRELKDFVAGFQAGYKMVDGPEDRDLKKARAEHYRSSVDKLRRDEESTAEADRRIAAARGGSTGSTGSVAPPEQVKAIIDANVPENMREYAYKMAKGESNFNPSASRGEGGAKGLFQFIPSTAKEYGINGKELDPAENTKAFVKFTMNNKATLTKLLGREPTWGELAVAHQQGAGGAWGLFTGRGTVKGKQAGNPKNADDIARYYGFDLKNGTVSTAAPKTEAIPTGRRDPLPLDSLPQKNMPEPGSSRSAAIDGGFSGFSSEFDTEPVQYAAEGGTIEDPTEITDEFAAKNNLTAQGRAELAGARRAAVDMAKQNNRPAELASNVGPAPMEDYPLGNALDAGLKFIQKAFGLGQRPAVRGSDPNYQKGVTAFAAGAGGSEEDTQAAEKAVSGGGQLPRSKVVEKTVQEVGKKFKDDPEAAGRAVGTLLQTYRQRTMQAGQQALKQIQSNDMVGALNTLKEAYDNVPDGNTVVFEPTPDGQGYVYKQLDANNKVMAEGPVTMQALAQQAKLAAGGMAFDQMIVRAAKPSSPQGPSGTGAAIPEAPPAPQDPRQAPAEAPVTQQVTAEGPAQTATDGAEAPPAAQPSTEQGGRTYAADNIQQEQPRPFGEPPPEMISVSGMDTKSSGYKQLVAYNKEAMDGWKARKAEHDKLELERVRKKYDADKLAARERDADARRELAARSAAELEDKRNTVRDRRAQASAENVAKTQAAGRVAAEEIRVRGQERDAARKRADETEKANPMWERDRRLAAISDPLEARSEVAGKSPISMQDSADLKRASENSRTAINYDAQPRAKAYADQEFAQRSQPIQQEITTLGEKDPQNVRRYTALADRVAQRNDTDPSMIASMVYGMITNRWSDADRPTVLRDGFVAYKGTKLAMPPDVLMTIVAENGRRSVNSDRAFIEKRDKDTAEKQSKAEREVRFSKKDLDNASDLVQEGGSAGLDLGYDTPARTPRFQAIPVDPSRLRR